jgi:hypothetical protein
MHWDFAGNKQIIYIYIYVCMYVCPIYMFKASHSTTWEKRRITKQKQMYENTPIQKNKTNSQPAEAYHLPLSCCMLSVKEWMYVSLFALKDHNIFSSHFLFVCTLRCIVSTKYIYIYIYIYTSGDVVCCHLSWTIFCIRIDRRSLPPQSNHTALLYYILVWICCCWCSLDIALT